MRFTAHVISGLFILTGLGLISCSTPGNGDVKHLDVAAFEQQLTGISAPQLLDVRTPEEYKGGHLQNAVNVDWNADDFDEGLKNLDKGKAVFVYCLSGGRSASASKRLAKLGFTTVYDLKGGIIAWQNTDRPVVLSEGATAPVGWSLEEYNGKLISDLPVLVDFYAPWCGPCKKMAPVLEELTKTYPGKFKLVKVNADPNRELMKTLGIAEIPMLMVYRDGEIVWQHFGLTERSEFVKALELE